MRRSTTKQDKVCPSCKKVVEYGVVCDSCNSFFHATEACCGDGLADAFTSSRQGAWNCTNCLPKQGKPRENDLSAERRCAAAEVELVEWRRAAVAGCRVAGAAATTTASSPILSRRRSLRAQGRRGVPLRGARAGTRHPE